MEDLATTLQSLATPASMSHLDDAARLLADAIAAGERMTIVADYDADGATACAVGVRALRAMGAKVDFLVPNRFEHSYGLSPEIVLPSSSTLDSRAGSSRPRQALVGVMIQASSTRALMLPELPAVRPRSNMDFPNQQISSRSCASVTAAP